MRGIPCIGVIFLCAIVAFPAAIYCADDSVTCGVAAFTKNLTKFDVILPEHRLLGGVQARPHSWPWAGQLVLMTTRGKIVLCGCVLIDPEFVLTAAHCVAARRNPRWYMVLLGGHTSLSGTKYIVRKIIIHPLYMVRLNAFDVALLRIWPRVKVDDEQSPICLPTLPVAPNKVCVVAGWGRMGDIRRNASLAPSLREIQVPILLPTGCSEYKLLFDPVSMICAGYDRGHIDACQGDSGGPLMCQQNGKWELQGLVSMGMGCGRERFPGIYSKVVVVAPWVRLQMNLALG